MIYKNAIIYPQLNMHNLLLQSCYSIYAICIFRHIYHKSILVEIKKHICDLCHNSSINICDKCPKS